MSIKRLLIKVHTPPAHQGFLGAGHTARAVMQVDFTKSRLLQNEGTQRRDG